MIAAMHEYSIKPFDKTQAVPLGEYAKQFFGYCCQEMSVITIKGVGKVFASGDSNKVWHILNVILSSDDPQGWASLGNEDSRNLANAFLHKHAQAKDPSNYAMSLAEFWKLTHEYDRATRRHRFRLKPYWHDELVQLRKAKN